MFLVTESALKYSSAFYDTSVVDQRAEHEAVFEQALICLRDGIRQPLIGQTTLGWSERCVEVPWISGYLASSRTLLDIGWSMSPPEWLRVLLEAQEMGTSLTGIDIIDPHRVASRYPPDIRDEVLSVPVRVEDFLTAQPNGESFDTITCLSTLEHIGFDVASSPDDTDSAFVRAKSPEQASSERSSSVDHEFMTAAAEFLEPGGRLLVTVPAGQGTPILHQDSLGLFTYQYEYDETSWRVITEDSRFKILEEVFYRYSSVDGWNQVTRFSDLADQTSALMPFATGCALVCLERR